MGKHAKADIYTKIYDFFFQKHGRGDIFSYYLILFLMVNLFCDWLSSEYHSFEHRYMVSISSDSGASKAFLYQGQIASEFGNIELNNRILNKRERVFEHNLSQTQKDYDSVVAHDDHFSNMKYISQIAILFFAIVDIIKGKKCYPRIFPYVRIIILLGSLMFMCYFYSSSLSIK